MNGVTTTKHLIRRTSTEPGFMTRYHAACGASGTEKQEYTHLLTATSCPKCAATLKPPINRRQAEKGSTE